METSVSMLKAIVDELSLDYALLVMPPLYTVEDLYLRNLVVVDCTSRNWKLRRF